MTEHDYTRRGWGHDIVFTPINGGMSAKCMGWGPRGGGRIEQGDTILLANPKSRSGISPYKVAEIKYKLDPKDMFSATLEFAPRQTREERDNG